MPVLVRVLVLVLVLAPQLTACTSRPDAFWIAGDVQLGPGHEALLAGALLALRESPGIVNLEGPIADGASYERRAGGRYLLRNRGDSAQLLRRAGVRVVSLANNHALDLGAAGRARSEGRLRGAGIAAAFDQRSARLALAGRIVRVLAFDLSAGLPDDLEHALRSSAPRDELTVALFHTSGPPSYLPTPLLTRAVELALAAGVRVIAAHGSHAVARVERRGAALIAWGLGNLAFDCPCSREDEGLILRVTLRADGSLAGEVIPIRAGLSGRPASPAPHAAELIALLNGLGSAQLRLHGLGAPF